MRLSLLLDTLAALLLALFIILFSTSSGVATRSIVPMPSPAKIETVPSQNFAPITITDAPAPIAPEATSTATSAPAIAIHATTTPAVVVKPPSAKKQIATTSPKVAASVTAPAVTIPTITVPVIPAMQTNSLDSVASTIRGALVNIVCYAPAGSNLKSISGSGIIIDSRGVILTNAHVAQYFLLGDRGVDCEIRTGSPAVYVYTAAPMFISSTWLRANSTVLTQTQPTGDGENDYALLAIVGAAPDKTLPTTFPSLPLSEIDGVPRSTAVVIGSYGAQFLEASQIQSSLFPTIVFGSIKDIYTFTTNDVDVFALGGTAAAQEGSSGGGVADSTGTLVATITTSTVEGDTSTRNLNSITAGYIRRAYATETGQSFDTLLVSSPTVTANAFAPKIPALEAIITASLQ